MYTFLRASFSAFKYFHAVIEIGKCRRMVDAPSARHKRLGGDLSLL